MKNEKGGGQKAKVNNSALTITMRSPKTLKQDGKGKGSIAKREFAHA